MREILKIKSEGDFVWMNEVRKIVWVFVVWDVREKEREREMKLVVKKKKNEKKIFK